METAVDAQTYSVALTFEDGVTQFIACRPDQTVADAAYRQRINIPLDCRDGACGTCKALCEAGSYDGGTYISDALSADEAAQGYALPCSMKPHSDLVLRIASTSDVAKTQAAIFTGTLVDLLRLSPTTVRFSLQIPNRDTLVFLPGQYVNIAVPGTHEHRSYSFANAPSEDRLTFLVKLTEGGAMSDYLDNRAAIGDPITFTGPHGSFFLREARHPALMVAGGTGLAPILAILRTMRDAADTRTVHLIYGVTTDDDIVALDDLRDLAADLTGFTWDYCVADNATRAASQGMVTTLIQPDHLHDGDVAVYLCGPPKMVEAVRSHVNDLGIEPTGFYYEKFALAHADATPQPAQAAAGNRAAADDLLPDPAARAITGQTILAQQSLIPSPRAASTIVNDLDADTGALIPTSARAIAGQTLFPASPPHADPPVPRPTATSAISDDGYQIGEEHPAVHDSDALFEAREALELGALELTLGRLSSQQLSGYRLLAESTMPYVRGDRFVDAAQYTETNAAFHDYLFTLTGNKHLLHAYQALGVKGRMSEVLRNATWCHPLCARDHIDIVEAFEAGDRDHARALIVAHAGRSKQTMRRAMSDATAARRPRTITPGRFNNKVVIVTGAAQGIGEQSARRINAEGGTVILADRSELIEDLAAELGTIHCPARAVVADLERYDGATSMIRHALSEFGRIDVLINNVGGAMRFKPFVEFTEAEIRAELDRSLLTTLFACRAALPPMVARGHGVIVNVSSAATRGIHRIPYSAAKGGINAITASLALEYADAGIRVVATAPGGTDAPPRRIPRSSQQVSTDPEKAWFQAHIDQTIASSLLKRYGTLDEQAAAICFLASDEASYITGSVLPVAGGDQG